MKTLSKQAAKELIDLFQARSRNGCLRPKQIVEWAKANPSSKLYSLFEWDNSVCGDRYRIQQAREMLVAVEVLIPKYEPEIQYFTSLPSDRATGSGYRRMQDVLASPEKRKQLIEMAMEELQRWTEKYKHIEAYCKGYATVVAALKAWAASL